MALPFLSLPLPMGKGASTSGWSGWAGKELVLASSGWAGVKRAKSWSWPARGWGGELARLGVGWVKNVLCLMRTTS